MFSTTRHCFLFLIVMASLDRIPKVLAQLEMVHRPSSEFTGLPAHADIPNVQRALGAVLA